MDDELHAAVTAAQNGSREALETVAAEAQGLVYNVALRMLQRPQDAEDATQEILIKIITHLGQFRGESRFSTWVYRLTYTTLVNMQTRDRTRAQISFDDLSLRLEESLAHYEPSAEEAYETAELTEEVRRSCTLGMLQCLNREDRFAILLGDVLEVSSVEGAAIMNVTPAAYRKRLSRARELLMSFVAGHCGLVNSAHACRCNKHVRSKIAAGQLDPLHLHYTQPHDPQSAYHLGCAQDETLEPLTRAVALMRSHPSYLAAQDVRQMVARFFNAGDADA